MLHRLVDPVDWIGSDERLRCRAVRPEDDMSQIVLRVLGMVGVLFAVAAPPANAQDTPVRVRGTIERVDGDVYVVKARGGAELKVKLAENAMVVALIKASLADIK